MAKNVFRRQLRIVGNSRSMVIDSTPFESGIGCGIFGCSGCLSVILLVAGVFAVITFENPAARVLTGIFAVGFFVFMLITLLKSAEGERLIIKNGTLTIRKDIWGFKREKQYDVESIKDLHVLPPGRNRNPRHRHGGSASRFKLGFLYNDKPVLLGIGLSAAQSDKVLRAFKMHRDFYDVNFFKPKDEDLLY